MNLPPSLPPHLPGPYPPPPDPEPLDEDTIDVRTVGRALRRDAKWIAAFTLAGALLAGLIAAVLPPRYDARATVVMSSPVGTPSLGGDGGLVELLSGASQFDTELEILSSRRVLGGVVDSLQLQVRLESPAELPRAEAVRVVSIPRDVVGGAYEFERASEGRYRVSGPMGELTVAAGRGANIGRAVLTVEPKAPESFTLTLLDHLPATLRLERELEIEQTSGEVAAVEYSARDRVSVAAVPNTVVREYVRYSTADELATNRERVRFLDQKIDSVRVAMLAASRRLGAFQQERGALDPTFAAEAERGADLSAELDRLEVEMRSLDRILAEIQRGPEAVSALAGYPTFLESSAVNDLLARLLTLQTERRALLQRRTETDPEVRTLDQQVAYLTDQLVELARSYRENVGRRFTQLQRELANYRTEVAARHEGGGPIAAEYERLLETYFGLQQQTLEVRLAAIAAGEGIRQIDVAQVPEEPAFPEPLLFIAVGTLVGLLLGAVVALGRAALSERIEDARQVAAMTGRPAFTFRPGLPILPHAADGARALLVLPVGAGARSLPVA
ncbi:MAG: GumC family protein, partial [Longimicrobiales bacterium]